MYTKINVLLNVIVLVKDLVLLMVLVYNALMVVICVMGHWNVQCV